MNDNRFTRRCFLRQTLRLGMLSLMAPFGLNPQSCLAAMTYPSLRKRTISSGTYLFVDDTAVKSVDHIERMVHPATKLSHPVLRATAPFEMEEPVNGIPVKRLYMYGTVLRDQETGLFRMWYHAYKGAFVATSTDGITWERPNLGFYGNSNRIDLFDLKSISIIKDDQAQDPDKRYKLLGYKRGGYRAAYSADGLAWKLYQDAPVLLSSDTITLAQDPQTGEYLAFYKYQLDGKGKGRRVFLSRSRDMLRWSEQRLILAGDEEDKREAMKLPGGTHVEFYNMSAFYHANQWIGFATRFRRTGEPKAIAPAVKGRKLQSMSDGVIDVVLTTSNDGNDWQRCANRNPVIPVGPYNYDAGTILGLCNTPLFVGNEVWMYYTGLTTTHGGAIPEKENSICLAKWRRDGFVSLASEEQAGAVVTVGFKATGQRLQINANAASGWLSVELLNKQGTPLKGYRREDCLPIESDGIHLPVAWKRRKRLPKKGEIHIRFILERSRLYSFTLDNK